jgi:hypothetical protein
LSQSTGKRLSSALPGEVGVNGPRAWAHCSREERKIADDAFSGGIAGFCTVNGVLTDACCLVHLTSISFSFKVLSNSE